MPQASRVLSTPQVPQATIINPAVAEVPCLESLSASGVPRASRVRSDPQVPQATFLDPAVDVPCLERYQASGVRQTSRVQSRSQAPQATCNVQVTEEVLDLSLNPAIGEATCLEGSPASGKPHAESVQSRFQVPPATVTVQIVGTSPNPVRGTAFGSVAGEALGTQVVDEVPHPGQDPLHSLLVDEEKGLGMSLSPTMSQAAVATLVGQAPQVEVNCQVAEASSPGCQVECGPASGQDRSLVIAQVSNLPNSVSNVACGSVVTCTPVLFHFLYFVHFFFCTFTPCCPVKTMFLCFAHFQGFCPHFGSARVPTVLRLRRCVKYHAGLLATVC